MLLIGALLTSLTITAAANAQAQQKTQQQIWLEQREGIVVGCSVNDLFSETWEPATEGSVSEETKQLANQCVNDMLYLKGVCEKAGNSYSFCQMLTNYLKDNGLDQLGDRPEQLSQETIDRINSHDWNGDGLTRGDDFVP